MSRVDRFERRAAERRRAEELRKLDEAGEITTKAEVYEWMRRQAWTTCATKFALDFGYDPPESARKAVGGSS